MKRVFIVHGWDGSPSEGWFPWLKAELEKRGYAVAVPAMPHPEKPTIEDWVNTLAGAVGKADTQTYFVGHSIGCQTILRYLASLPKGSTVGGAVFVAGFLLPLINNEDPETEQPWIQSPLDAEKIKLMCKNICAIFSSTDRWVPLENKDAFEKQFGARTFIEDGRGEKGHFSGSDGVVELPKALELLLEMMAVPKITIDDLAKIEIRMGKILTAEKVEGADKLLKFSVDLGPSAGSLQQSSEQAGQASEVRTIISGVAQYYAPEQMIGKQVPVITNLAPRKMKGIESNGMILYAIDESVVDGVAQHKPVMLNPEKEVPNGSPVQ